MMANFKTRFMYNFDLDRVVEIDFKASGVYKWKREDFLTTLSEKNVLGIVASNLRNKVLGFCIYDLKTSDGFNILHMAVDNKHQRQKVATSLIAKMKSKLSDKRTQIEYIIEESNLSGQLFLKAMKFKSKLLRSSTSEDLIKFTYQKE